MNAQATTLRRLTVAETALVSGGFNGDEFIWSAASGAAIGAPVGAVLLGPVNMFYGAFVGGFVGSFFGGAYYVGSELIDYCF